MSSTDEVLIDEVRWPRMFGNLRRAGMYRRCGCAGCAPCRGAAQRLLRGVVRTAQSSAPYRPDQWGSRYRLLSRTLGPRVIQVLADMAAGPTILDVQVHPSNASVPTDPAGYAPPEADGVEEEFQLHQLLAARIPPTVRTADGRSVKELVATGGIPGVAPIRFERAMSIADLELRDALSSLPSSPGLYLVQWDGGQYLGMARDLRSRIPQHLEAIRRFVRHPGRYRFYIARLAGDPRVVEKRILMALDRLVADPRLTVAARLARLGLTNRQREFEFVF